MLFFHSTTGHLKTCFCRVEDQSLPFAEWVKGHINYLSISISTTEKQTSKKKNHPKNYQPCIAKEKHSGKMRPYEERFGMPSKFYKTRNKKKQPSR